jgi:thiosulfate dehydrogenase (quinone) large subunit
MSETTVGMGGAKAHRALGRVKWAWGERRNELMFTALRVWIALEWLSSGTGKLMNPKYVSGFAATNANFAKGSSFSWYRDFLTGTVIPNHDFFAYFTMYGEIFAGVALLLGLLTNAGAIAAFLLNLNFWLAAGYSGGSTFGVNFVMGGAAIVLLLAPGSKWLSVDRWLAERPLKALAVKHPRLTGMMIGRKVAL